MGEKPNELCLEARLGDTDITTLPESLDPVEVYKWETELTKNPEAAIPYSDWCEEHGWDSKAEQLRKGVSSGTA